MTPGDREERFRPAGTVPGRVFVPILRGERKHPCRECFACQWCADPRCDACRRGCQKPEEAAAGSAQE